MPPSLHPTVAMGALWPWGSLYNRSQPLALALARQGCPVYYLNPHERRRIIPGSLGRWLVASGLRPSAWVSVRPGVHPNLHLVDVASLRARAHDWWMRDYTPAAERALSRELRRLGRRGSPLHLFASRPLRTSLLRACAWSKVTVDVVDPWPLMPWGELPLAQVGIAQMLARADVIVSNGQLAGDLYRQSVSRPIHDLANGVETALVEALVEPPPPPEVFARGRGRFRVLFAGAIDMRLNFDVLASVIPEFPDVDFFFVGKALVPPEALPVWHRMLAMGNCFFGRSVPYAAMPGLLGNAHGLMLPYSEWGSNCMFPGKLLEYVAAARPIFATALAPELEAARDAFSLYRDAPGLCAALRAARASSFRLPNTVIECCRRLARESTWDRRAESLCRIWAEG